MGKEEGVVVLAEEEVVKDTSMSEEEMADAGFLKEEIDIAKKHNIIRKAEKDGKNEREQIDASKKDIEQTDKSKLDSKQGEVNIEDLDSFEKVHEIFEKQPDKFRDLPKNVKALYHNSKGLYKKAKIEEQKRVEIEKKYEYDTLRFKAAETREQKIRETLKKDNLTVEDLEAILAVERKEVTESKSDNKETVQRQQQEFIQSRIAEADKLGRAEYDDFDNIVQMAQQIVAEKPRQMKILQDSLTDDTVSEKELVDLVVDIARLHKDFGKKAEKEVIHAEPTDEKVDRMIKNSQKKPTSASLGGGSGSRTKSYDDLTAEDVSRMSYEEYKKLPDTVRRRLKEELD